MRAVEILMAEHGLFLEFLKLLATGAERIGTDQAPDREFFEKAVSFCRDYADKAHHYKEEHVMFGLLAQKHEGRIDAQIQKHRDQHEHCRNLVNEISGAIESYDRGDAEGTRVLTRNLADYVQTLRSHITSEDEVFFPMAEIYLSEEEGEALLDEFKRYEETAGVVPLRTGPEAVSELAGML
ncbi:MAG: hemerythrin domain-containing protein [Planctomycetota bacterium]|jgi:hemerythrin-like domain-containing protein